MSMISQMQGLIRHTPLRSLFVTIVLSMSLAGAPASAQEAGGVDTIRIGFIGPMQTGPIAISESLYDLVGQAARNGVLLAESSLGALTSGNQGPELRIFLASAPTASAAERAAHRLFLTENIDFLVGGIGDEQAHILAEVARAHGALFLNVGSSSSTLEEACNVFHVEASEAMYTNALIAWHVHQGLDRWFLVLEESADQEARTELIHDAIEAVGGPSAELVGQAVVEPGQALYFEELQQIKATGADIVLLFINALDQVAFESQQTTFGPQVSVAPYPYAITQSREYLAALKQMTGGEREHTRIALWEASLADAGAHELNDAYLSRFGKPMDPHGWSAYAAIRILYQAAQVTKRTDLASIAAYLLNPSTQFGLLKEVPLQFRTSDRRLEQPLYAVTTEDSPWGINANQQLAIASLAGVISPIPESDGEIVHSGNCY